MAILKSLENTFLALYYEGNLYSEKMRVLVEVSWPEMHWPEMQLMQVWPLMYT